MLAGTHHLFGLVGVDLRRAGQDRCFDTGLGERFVEVGSPVRDAAFLRDFLGRVQAAAADGRYFDTVDALERIQVLVRECALSNHADFHMLFTY